jgi:hypothetical protein
MDPRGTLDAFGKDPIDRGPPWRLTVELGGWNQAYKWDEYKDHVLALVRKELEKHRLEQRAKAKEDGVRYLDAPVKYQADHYEWLALRVCGRQRLRHGTHRVGLTPQGDRGRYEKHTIPPRRPRHEGAVRPPEDPPPRRPQGTPPTEVAIKVQV